MHAARCATRMKEAVRRRRGEKKQHKRRLKSPLWSCRVPLRHFILFFMDCGLSSPHHTDEAVNEYRRRYHYSPVWLELIEAFIKATGIDTFTNNTTLAHHTDEKYYQRSGRAPQISFHQAQQRCDQDPGRFTSAKKASLGNPRTNGKIRLTGKLTPPLIAVFFH